MINDYTIDNDISSPRVGRIVSLCGPHQYSPEARNSKILDVFLFALREPESISDLSDIFDELPDEDLDRVIEVSSVLVGIGLKKRRERISDLSDIFDELGLKKRRERI